jgi:hypothetical protein
MAGGTAGEQRASWYVPGQTSLAHPHSGFGIVHYPPDMVLRLVSGVVHSMRHRKGSAERDKIPAVVCQVARIA